MTATDPIAFRTAPPEFDVRQPDLIMPEWWAGTPAIDPARFTIDLGGGPLTDDDLRPGSGLAARDFTGGGGGRIAPLPSRGASTAAG